nr:retrovirus-related Pol polyprotein from transposon TNT 1-94 [Tanacetum cinerariifolium]
MLRIFGCVAYPHDKQGKLEPRAIKCVLLGYTEGVKWYRLYRIEDESPKIVTSRNMVFNENVMYKDTLKDSGAGADKSVKGLQVEVELDGFSEEEHDLRVGRSSSWVKAVQHTSIRVILALTAYKDYELEQLDVNTGFLHGNLKESPRQWYRRFDEYMLSNGFKRSSYDSWVYYRSYALGVQHEGARESKKILGMEIFRDRSRKILKVSQSGYISKILNNFIIDNGKSVKMSLGGHFKLSLKDCPVKDCDVERISMVPYANAVGSLIYLMVCTRPEIAYSAEYMALTEAVNEAVWLRGLLEELGVEINTVAVNCGNQGAIHVSRNHVFHERTKNINVRYHFIREVLEAKTVKVLKVGTEHNVVDALTKVLQANVELKDTIVVAMLKITGDGKLENLIIDGQSTIVDDAGNPLKKVENMDDHDCEDEVESVDNDTASERVGFGTQSQDLPEEIQAIRDNLDIRVRGRKMK